MTFIRLEQISLAFGEAPLLDHINLQIIPKERVFLIGRNGMGKSSLFKVIMGHMKPDDGKIFYNPGLKIAELAQTLSYPPEETVYNVVADGLQEMGDLLKNYHALTQSPPAYDSPSYQKWLKDLEIIQKTLEAKHGWEFQNRIESILTKLDLPPERKMASLSGGWQRRVALARALVSDPDVLLLDEPTNHLDLNAIEWLEDYLLEFKGAIICITHDRALLRRLSSRILELDRGKLTSFNGNYDKYLEDREHRLVVEETQAKLFDKQLAKEEAWIRQGIKARRTRNEGRVRALYKLREIRQQRRQLQGKPSFSANQAMNSGDLVIKAENITYSYPTSDPNTSHCLVQDFSINIFRGDKIAFTGPNGVGKTTLLKLLLGELQPNKGKVALGSKLHVAYFDQLRNSIDPELSAIENVAAGRETILIDGKEKHIISYLSDFLFIPDRLRMPIKLLSGGECNRLLLAKLFSLPNNLLVLDEPTNDLDIESLELLEEILINYQGTLLLVTHDRTFIDQVATSTLYFQGKGNIVEYVGGYKDIPESILHPPTLAVKKSGSNIQSDNLSKVPPESSTDKIHHDEYYQKSKQNIQNVQNVHNQNKNLKKLNSKLKQELLDIPVKISQLEAEQAELHVQTADPNFYLQDKDEITRILSKLTSLEEKLKTLYQRWEILENLNEQDNV